MPDSSEEQTAEPDARQHRQPIVGVGASLTRLASLDHFLREVGPDAGISYVVLIGPDEAVDQPRLMARLTDIARLPVSVVTDMQRVEPDKIYIAPTNAVLTVAHGRFHLEDKAPDGGALDTFLVSVAQECAEGAIGVLLGGIGPAGVLGLTALKERSGLTLVEAADEDGEPHRPHAGVIADFVLPPDQMAERIGAHIRHLRQLEETRGLSRQREEALGQITRIAAILRNKTGHDFHGYKQNTFLRRVQRQMQVLQIDDVETYIERLRDNPDHVQHLFQDLLIGVTQFFRDNREFEFLKAEVVPTIFAERGAGDNVRIWVLGCATGEEAYSLAILLREHMASLDAPPHVQIFATDIDGRSLAAARVGRYTEAIARDVSPERLARWFTKEGHTYCIAKELREMCIFSSHNLIKDAPFSRIDLISCRNLLIYLNTDLQKRVLPLFHFALRAEGYLFLGTAENITRQPKLFAPVDRRHRIFRRLESATRVLPDFPLTTVRGRREDGQASRARRPENGVARRAERVAERHAPAYVVIDEAYEVLHFAGRTGRYLNPSPGAASLNLLNLVDRDLRLDLRAALQTVVASRRPVRLEDLDVGMDGERHGVTVLIEPVPVEDGEGSTLVVLFQDNGALDGQARSAAPSADQGVLRDEHVRRLETELRLTKERLQTTIEELEATNEELKSSNEEYQSVNEELQSANEELETSKEELQSVNEEMQTVNGELGHRVSELARANSDLKNLLESTQIATVFLDNDLRVSNFTPAVTDIFHLIETDVGRPIAHIALRIAYPELHEDVRRVLRTLNSLEREVEDPETGARYMVRVLPYRSTDNFIAGAVLTFLDVTATAQAQRALQEAQERFQMMEQIVPAILFTMRRDLELDHVNQRFYDFSGLTEGAALGTGWLAAVHPDDVEDNQRRWKLSAESGEVFEQEFRLRGRDGAFRWFMTRALPQTDETGQVVRWVGSCTDTNERRLSANRQSLLLSELQHRVRNILAVVRSVASNTVETSTDLSGFAEHFDGRLSALARTQSVIARSADGGGNLEEMLRDELFSQGARDGESVTLSGPDVRLSNKQAETLGLALHELVTNAIKYGALGEPSGRLDVTWQVHRSRHPRLHLVWQESGVAITDGQPTRFGFGRELIEQALPYELGATTALELRREGVRCVIEMPLDRDGADGALRNGIEPGERSDGG